MPVVAAVLSSLAVSAFFVGLQVVLFRVLGKLAMDTSGLSSVDGSPVYGLGDALQSLPAWIIQLLNFMYLDQCVMIVATALLFSALMRLFLGGSNA